MRWPARARGRGAWLSAAQLEHAARALRALHPRTSRGSRPRRPRGGRPRVHRPDARHVRALAGAAVRRRPLQPPRRRRPRTPSPTSSSSTRSTSASGAPASRAAAGSPSASGTARWWGSSRSTRPGSRISSRRRSASSAARSPRSRAGRRRRCCAARPASCAGSSTSPSRTACEGMYGPPEYGGNREPGRLELHPLAGRSPAAGATRASRSRCRIPRSARRPSAPAAPGWRGRRAREPTRRGDRLRGGRLDRRRACSRAPAGR